MGQGPAGELFVLGNLIGTPFGTDGVVLRLVPAPPSADLDGSGIVDGDDLLLLLGAWGTANVVADLDESGDVGGTDLLILLGRWGTPG